MQYEAYNRDNMIPGKKILIMDISLHPLHGYPCKDTYAICDTHAKV